MRKIGFASDHAGYRLKMQLIDYLNNKEYSIVDFGCNSNESCDYPDFAHLMAKAIQDGELESGISICGSGNGINMVVNKYSKIRSALCWNKEIAILARTHNNANVCALPARFIAVPLAKQVVDIFLETAFDGGRHQIRIDKIPIA